MVKLFWYLIMINIKNLNIINKRVLIRVDYNIPIIKSKIINDFRLKSSFETINYCLSQNCSIVLMSHLGRPKQKDDKYSLQPIIEYLEDNFNTYVHFSDDCISEKSIKTSKEMLPKEIHLLENLRFYKEELINDLGFAEKLSKHGEYYICDSFGTSHRMHASNSSILSFYKNKSAIGFLMLKEFKYLTQSNLNSNKLTVIIGGAKISTKLKMIDCYIGNCNNIIIGGAMAFTLLKASDVEVGLSLIEDDMIYESKRILERVKNSKTNLLLPVDIVCKNTVSNDISIEDVNNIGSNQIGLDIGPESTLIFSQYIEQSSYIVWNGPMGMFEELSFATGTQSIADTIANVGVDSKTIIGGGDTVSAIEMTQPLSRYTHVSTGGGASLKLLSGEKLDFHISWEKYAK